MTTHSKLSLTSEDPNAQRNEALKSLFPDAFREGKVDFDSLKASLGGIIEDNKERYGLTWAGKAEAIRAIQGASVGTLLPDRDASVDFDTTKNLIIEGDNLEVLKLLQKSYHGKVKMIYIDPPYNTGNEFIYPDNFREGLQDYLRYSGQVMDDGTAASSLRDTGGRIHSKWLSMMYPRLFLAKNLLREDGVIFVSIDDHEVANLRMVMDEIFGEENFLSELIWQNKTGGGAKSKGYIVLHEYVLCYMKRFGDNVDITAEMSAKTRAMYNKRDEHFNRLGSYATWPLDTTSMDERANLRYPIFHEGHEIWPRKQWLWSEERVKKAQKENKLVFNYNSKEDTWSVRFKGYIYDDDGIERLGKPMTLINGLYTQQGTQDFAEFLDRTVFPFPKPVNFAKQLLSIETNAGNSRQMSGGGEILYSTSSREVEPPGKP